MKPKRINSVVHSWKSYPHRSGGPKHLSEKEYKLIMKLFFEKLAYQIITTGQKIVLPYYFGAMQAIKYKSNNPDKLIDYKKTKELYGEHNKENPDNRKVVKIKNMATNGYWCTIHWYKSMSLRNKARAIFKNSRNFEFKLTRPNVRPNSYNKRNPKVSLVPFFREKGWLLYETRL